MNVFAPPVFFLYEHTGGLSLEPFYFHNFTACFPCWDVPHWIRQCRSFVRRLLLNYICHVLAILHFPPAHPKWSRKGKDRSCTLTQVFFRGICTVRVSVPSSMSQGQEPGGGRGQCGVPVCCIFPPSARFGGLQALLLSSSPPCFGFRCSSP